MKIDLARNFGLAGLLLLSASTTTLVAQNKAFDLKASGASTATPVASTPLPAALEIPPELKGVRSPVPDAAGLTDATRRANSAFSDVLRQAQNAAGRTEAAKTIYKSAVEETNSALRYSMLLLARNTAARAGNTDLTFEICDTMSALYEIESLKLKSEAAAMLVAAFDAEYQRQEFVDKVSVMVEASASNDFSSAASLLRLASAQSRIVNGSSMEAYWASRVREIQEAQTAYTDASKALQKVAGPDADAESRLKAGRYLCFYQGDWTKGLPLLADSGDDALKKLAQQEIAAATDDAKMSMADAWWNYSEQVSGVARRNIRSHAAVTYEAALPTLSGLAKAQSTKRVDEVKSALAMPAAQEMRTVTVEGLIDGDSELHIRTNGLQWVQKSGSASKPGRHGNQNEPTFVNGRQWLPKWGKPSATGADQSDLFPLKLTPEAKYLVEVVAIGSRRGANTLEGRDEIQVATRDGVGVITIPDGQTGSKWYRLKLTRSEKR